MFGVRKREKKKKKLFPDAAIFAEQNFGERGSKVRREDRVDHRIEERVEIARPG